MRKLATNEFVVNCTPEEAFAFLSDQRNELKWNPDNCQSVEKITDGPIGKGTKYRAKWKASPRIEIEYVEFDAPRSWEAHSDGSLQANFRCTIEPHPDGAKVAATLELIPHGLFKLAFPLFARIFDKQAKEAAERMRTTINAYYAAS